MTARPPSIVLAVLLLLVPTSGFDAETNARDHPLPPVKPPEDCTIGVAMGNATTDGRPFSWKNRDGSGRHFVWYQSSDGTYDYLAMGNDEGLKMGVNEV